MMIESKITRHFGLFQALVVSVKRLCPLHAGRAFFIRRTDGSAGKELHREDLRHLSAGFRVIDLPDQGLNRGHTDPFTVLTNGRELRLKRLTDAEPVIARKGNILRNAQAQLRGRVLRSLSPS